MPTLETLRTYVDEIAYPDASGSTHDRERVRVINDALARVWREHDWTYTLRTRPFTAPPWATGVAMTLTQDSNAVSLGGAEIFSADYVTDEWDLSVVGENRIALRIEAITDSPTNQNATLWGLEWHLATGVYSYTFRKSKYDLPENAQRVRRVFDVISGTIVHYVEPMRFDHIRLETPQTANFPVVYTVRDGRIEFWPAPPERTIYNVTYKRAAPTYAAADAGSTEVEWEDEKLELLLRAIDYVASYFQGENAPIPLVNARAAYDEAAKGYKQQDSRLPVASGPMGVPSERSVWPGMEIANPSGTISIVQ